MMKRRSKELIGVPGPWARDFREASDHFTSKIGGFPDWPESAVQDLANELLRCSACGCLLCLVAQIHAPISDGNVSIDERVIYIFCCPVPTCAASSLGWRALRLQKAADQTSPSRNAQEVIPPDTTLSTWLEDDTIDDCDIDYDFLSKAFSEIECSPSATKKSQRKGKFGAGKLLNGDENCNAMIMETTVLPCFYTYTQEVSSPTVADPISLPSSSKLMETQDVSNYHEDETWEQEAYEYDNSLHADRMYLKFKKLVDANPEQCFRYSYGGRPILAAATSMDPGICELCGCKMHFEMQLMPPVIYFLQEVADKSQENIIQNWNWITILVYSCSKACFMYKGSIAGWIVAEDNVIVQND